jgi:hypothetical protein
MKAVFKQAENKFTILIIQFFPFFGRMHDFAPAKGLFRRYTIFQINF